MSDAAWTTGGASTTRLLECGEGDQVPGTNMAASLQEILTWSFRSDSKQLANHQGS